jgi:hypothetical protein
LNLGNQKISMMHHSSENPAQLPGYFEYLETTFQKASQACCGTIEHTFSIAENSITLHSAGKKLDELLYNAFAHLPLSTDSPNSLKIFVWDAKESNLAFEFPTPENLGDESLEKITEHYFKNYCVLFSERGIVLYAYDYQKNTAFVCIKDSDLLPNYFLASPLFRILKIWAKLLGFSILHAGCVANEKSSVIFVGKGGKGKSTTSLQCLLDGMYYLGDDYVLLDTSQSHPVIYTLYCSGKLHLNHITNFPILAQHSIYRPNTEAYDKPLLYLYNLFGDKMAYKRPLKAIIATQITKNTTTSYKPLAPFEALKALAPSTLLQLNLGDQGDFAKMGNITRTIPCYTLELGNDFHRIAPAVTRLLDSFD